MKKTKPIRIGIILAELGELNTTALKYLILQINTHLESIQFEFISDEGNTFSDYGNGENLNWKQSVDGLQKRLAAFKSEALAAKNVYGITENAPDHLVLISLARFVDAYYLRSTPELTVLALGYWEEHMAPPSIFEFIVTLLIVVGITEMSPTFAKSSSHYGTRGCIADFTAELNDARFKSLTGLICNECKAEIKKDGHVKLLREIQPILNRSWLGSYSDPTSPASITSKLGFDLFTTRGLAPTWRQRILSSLEEQGMQQAIKVIGTILLALLVTFFGLKLKN